MTKVNLMDEKKYKAAQKYLKTSLEHMIETGRSVRDFSEFALEKFGDKVLPHMRHFYDDIRHGRIKIKGLKKSPREIMFGLHVSPQEREDMIRLAAYVRAEKRGFTGGSAEQDWAEAEKEVNKKLEEDAGLVAKGRKALLSFEDTVEKEYDHIKHVIADWYEKTSEKITRTKKAGTKKKSSTKKPTTKKKVTKKKISSKVKSKKSASGKKATKE